MRKNSLLRNILILLAGIALASVIVVGYIEKTQAQGPAPLVNHLNPYVSQPLRRVQIPGASAIIPHLHAATAHSNTPTYTTDDVKQFILKKHLPWGFLQKNAHLTFKKVAFMTAKESSQLPLGDDLDRPDNAIVCYVLVHGPFTLAGLHLNGPVRPEAMKAEYGTMVFDGVTGNLLSWGVPAPQQYARLDSMQ